MGYAIGDLRADPAVAAGLDVVAARAEILATAALQIDRFTGRARPGITHHGSSIGQPRSDPEDFAAVPRERARNVPSVPAKSTEPWTWSVIKTPVGWVMAVASPSGLRRVLIGSNQKELIAQGLADHTDVPMTRDDAGMQRTMQALDAITRGAPAPNITTDVAGTAFQAKVWQALNKIPKGGTRSYSEIAKAIRKPKAARAVASACASNPIALVVPCHRVIHSDGSISGYAWGVDVKEALLDVEGARYRR